MVFKLYDCDIGITLNSVNYNFTHVDSVTIEDPERTRLIRGANAGNKTGLPYKEGIKEAKVLTVTSLDIPKDLHELMKAAYNDRSRMDFFVVDRNDGSSKIAKNCVLSQEPKQLTLDETPESLNVALIFESFDVSEIKKS